MTWSGLYTPLITPFKEDGSLDEEGICAHIEFQKKASVDGIVILGTTGEASTLTEKEKRKIIEIALREKGALRIIVGTGSSTTEQTCEMTRNAMALGADCALIVSPFYNKPTQEGIVRHYEKVASSCNLPIIVYHNPTRTGSTLEISTLKKIAEIPTVVGLKDSISLLQNSIETILCIKSFRPDFAYLCGDDPLLIPMMSVGADGIISASANLIPKEIKAILSYCAKGDYLEARKLFYSIYPLMKALFSESNPIGVKAACALVNLPAGHPRMPLLPMSEKNLEKLKSLITR